MTKIARDQATGIIETREPLGLFYFLDNGAYIAIDNSTGDAWVEEFSSLHQCEKWFATSTLTAEQVRRTGNGQKI